VTDEELLAAVKTIGSAEGIFAAPEGAALLPALQQLLARGDIDRSERIVLFNTGTGVKYLEAFSS
jgi:threonine synthase